MPTAWLCAGRACLVKRVLPSPTARRSPVVHLPLHATHILVRCLTFGRGSPCCSWPAGASLSAPPKKDHDVRSVAVGETLRRVATKSLFQEPPSAVWFASVASIELAVFREVRRVGSGLAPWCDCHWTDPNSFLCRASSLALPRSQQRRSGLWVSTAQHKLHTRRCFNPAGAVVASWRFNDGRRSAADSGAKEEAMGHLLARFSLAPRSTTQLALACRRVKARAKSRPLQRNRTRLQRSETRRPNRRRNAIVQLRHQDELQ